MARSVAFNGINGATGGYLLTLPARTIAEAALGVPLDKVLRAQAEERLQREEEKTFAPIAGVDPSDLAQAGWGIVFPAKGGRATEAGLKKLLDLRREQAGATEKGRFRILKGKDGYQPGDSARDFLERHDADPFGPVDPDILPFYLLLAGDADEIPFSFQYGLDVQHAVGRIAFDTEAGYERYAAALVAAESAAAAPKTATFFGVHNADDDATALSATYLVSPLAKQLGTKAAAWKPGFRTVVGDGATKAALGKVLGGDDRTTFVFTASHGMGFPKDDARQRTDQGALLCQDWPGPVAWKEGVPPEFYFAGADIPESADLSGSIVFHFACYGAGTPARNDFTHMNLGDPVELAAQPFVAALPRRLLERGALAVIGHVERAWGYSFSWSGNPHLATFASTIQRLLEGDRVGDAFDYFNLRHLSLSRAWSEEVQAVKEFNATVVPRTLARLWTAERDAQSYVVIGDPAVRLAT